MITGQWSVSAVQNMRRLRRWIRLHLMKQLWTADYFSDPGSHARMLVDKVRCEAYRDALKKMIEPGSVVADLGAGTGLLSFFAVEAGAKRVYAIEMSKIADLAAQLIEANHLTDRIILIRGNSKSVRLPEPCDLLVTETLTACGFDNENIIDYVADARRRLLKSSAKIVPESCYTLFMPVQSEEFGLGRFPRRLYGIDYSPFRAEYFSKPIRISASATNLTELADAERCWHVDLLHDTRTPSATALDFNILQRGRLDGFVGWFEANLCPGVSLSNSPKLPPTCWPQFYFPVVDQPELEPGQRLRLEVDPKVIAGEAQWEYQVSITSPASSQSQKPQESVNVIGVSG